MKFLFSSRRLLLVGLIIGAFLFILSEAESSASDEASPSNNVPENVHIIYCVG